MRESHDPDRIAVFDVDRTLLVKTSAEEQLIRFLRQRKMLPLFNFVRGLFMVIRKLPRGMEEVIQRKSIYLSGLDVKDIQSLLPEFVANYLQPCLSPSVLEYVRMLKDKAYEIILISGSLDFLVHCLVVHLGADGGVGSKMEIRDGKFTGRIVGIHPYYYGKVMALQKYLEGREIDYLQSYSFGDSWRDIPLLSLFGHPVVVNPGRIMKKKAQERGWKIIHD